MKQFWRLILIVSLCLGGAASALADSVKGEMVLDGDRMKFVDPDNWYSFRTPITGETSQNPDGSRNFMWDSPEGKFYLNIGRNTTPTGLTPEALDAAIAQMITPGSADDLAVAKDVTEITNRSVLILPGAQPVKMAVWHVVAGANRLFYGIVLTPKGSLTMVCLGDRPDCPARITSDLRIEAGAF